MKKIIFFVITILALTLTHYIYISIKHTPPVEAVIIIEKGATISQVGKQLADKHIIKCPLVFRGLAFYYHHKNKYLQPGEYQFLHSENLGRIINKIISGERLLRKITVPEGYNRSQILQLLQSTYGLVQDRTASTPQEGELFPSTYHYYYGDKASTLINSMLSNMSGLFASNPIPLDHPLTTVNQILTLASIVEKETSINAERPLVASVYLNRLKHNIPLQADPTVIYGLFAGNTDFHHTLSKADLLSTTPYNTYIHPGLPPTPIASPGKESILATLYPAHTNYLYFVADGAGGHRFAKSLQEHNKNVALLRKLEKEKK